MRGYGKQQPASNGRGYAALARTVSMRHSASKRRRERVYLMFSLSLNITRKAWMSNPRIRWDAGLQRAGLAWRTSNSRAFEPPINPSYTRTGQFADKSDFEITEVGKSMNFGGVFYSPFVLFGTSKWVGWPGHLDNSASMMQQGFINGVKEYDE